MKKVAIQERHRNHYFRRGHQLHLFAWQQTLPRNKSCAASQLAKRFGLSVDRANTVACLTGIGGSRHEG
jgi:hypothetical protein